jgi:hypothetical protein
MRVERRRTLSLVTGPVIVAVIVGLFAFAIKRSDTGELVKEETPEIEAPVGVEPVALGQVKQADARNSTARKSGKKETRVPAGPNSAANGRVLQAAIDKSKPGDTLVLDAGKSYLGPITLPVKPGNGPPIRIQTSALARLPVAGQRVGPEHAAGMAKILSPGNHAGGLYTADGAHHYTLLGLEFTSTAAMNLEYAYINFGNDGVTGLYTVPQTTAAQVPHDLVLDRCYIHGLSGQNSGNHGTRGISLHSATTSILGCYIAQIHSSGADAQGIWGANGPGPYEITNNYIEATGENLMFGGAYQQTSGMVPANATIQFNDFKKPMKWNPHDPTGAWRHGENYDGSHWSVKNLFELKSGEKFVIDSNIFEGCWVAAQAGWAILLTPRAGDQGGPWTHISDITFTNNLIQDTAQGFDMLGSDDANPSGPLKNIVIQNNLFENVGNSHFGPALSTYHLFYLGSGVSSGSTNVKIDHNTWHSPETNTGIGIINYTQTRFTFTNNIVPYGKYGIYFDTHGDGLAHSAGWLADGVVSHNVIFQASPSKRVTTGYWGSSDRNYYPAHVSAVGFVNHAGGNYALAATSKYHKKGLDGTDPGTHTFRLPRNATGRKNSVVPSSTRETDSNP